MCSDCSLNSITILTSTVGQYMKLCALHVLQEGAIRVHGDILSVTQLSLSCGGSKGEHEMTE